MRPNVAQLVSDKQTSQKWYHDARRKDRTWAMGERVLVRHYRRDTNKWSRGQITKVLGTRTYLVMLEEGLVVKWHTDQIQEYREPWLVERRMPRKEEVDWPLLEDDTQVEQPEVRDGGNPLANEAEEAIGPNTDPLEQEQPEPPRRYPTWERRPTHKPGFVRL